MRSLKALVVLGALIAAPLFAKTKGHLYRLDTDEVILVEFTHAVVAGHGKICVTLPSHEKLEGVYAVVREGGPEWGSVYMNGYSSSHPANGYGSSAGGLSPGTEQGTAILTGGDNKKLTCEFVVNSFHGHGGCQDQDGNLYKLIF